jgi:hypothetical protein
MFEKGTSIEVAVRFIASTLKTLLTTNSLLSFAIILTFSLSSTKLELFNSEY